MTIEEQLKQEILSKYKSVRAFTTSIQIPYSTLDSVFKRGISNAGVSTMIKVFEALDLDIESLPSGELRRRNSYEKTAPSDSKYAEPSNLFVVETRRFPLLGNIACGEPIFADEDFEAYVEAGTNIKADFCLKAKGDSMIGARICDGDIVFIRKQDMVENGEIAAVLIEDEATLKRVFYDREANVLSLFAENPNCATRRYVGEELNNIRILGKAIAFQSDVR